MRMVRWSRWLGLLIPGLSVAALLLGCASSSPKRESKAAPSELCYAMLQMKTCVAGPPPPSDVAMQVRKLKPRPDAGRLVFVRARDGDIRGKVSLDLNGKPLETVIPFSAISVDVSPGTHEVRIPDSTDAAISLYVLAGEVAVLEVRRRGGYGSKFGLLRLSRPEGRELLDESRVLRVLDRTGEGLSTVTKPAT